MIVSLVLSSLFVSSANAEDEGVDLPLPFVGANVKTRDRCTMVMAAAPWNTDNAGKLVIDYAEAGSICLDAEGDLEVAKARALAIIARGDAEAALISAAAIPVMNGGSVDYESTAHGTVRLTTGPAAEWSAYGHAVTAGNGVIGGMPMGYVDPQWAMLYRMGYNQNAFGAHPAIPGVVMQPWVAGDSAALSECQSQLAEKTTFLKACDGGS